ncbi:hypothetical protein GEMRC1_006455 [Eukaryota sp. GEM-RC1]
MNRLLYSSALHISYFTRDLTNHQGINKSDSKSKEANFEARNDVLLMRKRQLLRSRQVPKSAHPKVINTKKEAHRRFELPKMSRMSRAVSAPLYRVEDLSKEFVKDL